MGSSWRIRGQRVQSFVLYSSSNSVSGCLYTGRLFIFLPRRTVIGAVLAARPTRLTAAARGVVGCTGNLPQNIPRREAEMEDALAGAVLAYS